MNKIKSKKIINKIKKSFKILGIIIIFISLFGFLEGFENYTLALNQFSLSQHNSDLAFNMVNLKAGLLEKGSNFIPKYDISNFGKISFEDLHYTSYIQLGQYKALIEKSFFKIIESFIMCIAGVFLVLYKKLK